MIIRRKYLYWSIIIVLTILPIIIDINLKEEMQRLSTFVWSLFLIPNILIMMMCPKWRVVIGTACFYSFLKYCTQFFEEGFNNKIESTELFLESCVNGAILLTVSCFRLRYNKLLKQMQKLIIIDSLTGLYNRRYFELFLEKSIPISQRMKSSLILFMIDIDHFKQVNDNHGHQCGDEALKHVSNIIKCNVRNSDAYVRLGGEEFAIILPNTNIDEGQIIAERIREAIEQSNFTYKNEQIQITISIGVSRYNGEKVEEFIEKADKALYKAKEIGRNQVINFGLS